MVSVLSLCCLEDRPYASRAHRVSRAGRVRLSRSLAYARNVAVVEVEELARTYRTSTGILRRRTVEVEAVRGVSFEIPKGELFGLLGPNGAGKTTTIKMLIT